ncbi:MAG: extracellular solute-binding protein [Deltaproteobacteria bacterium]|nr:extracellular solute-binding protein [Deltaproteobacteria bacterium]MBI2230979.1 extracellular solute-binding protein [Deltaproteobacteria bacterium]MBI2364184.1 extracellular solute-binding protein [Deltaproteobacteria bacterium]MBI2532159.1 extracellular solute-binding protein [Deltaproteobacteria bacterium]MBI3065831.1 extracellular solute-binding protein [Deltaproteobacteria bacterium]
MKLLTSALVLTLSLLSTAWAQTGKPMALAQLAAYNKPDREKVLYAGAKAEGKITWYTSLAGDSYKKLAAAFEAKYPGVRVETYRGTRQDLSARISAENQAQRYIVDTIETTIPLLKLLKDQQSLVPYTFPTQAKFPDHVKEKGPKGLVYWAIDRESHIGLAYNKNMIAPALAPRNYEGLLRPELKDKIAFAGSDTGVTVTGALLKFKGEEFVKKLKTLNPAIHNVSGRALLDMVISGEVGVSPSTFRNHVEVSLKVGAPIDWIPMDVVPSNSGSTAVSVKAPHPHAALLMADFILGPGGQKVLEEYQYGSPLKDYGFKRWYPEQGLSAEQIDKLEERWRNTLRDMTRRSSF